MNIQEFLFSFTFLFGIVYLLSNTVLFTKSLETFTEAFTIKTPRYFVLLGYWIFYLSMFYQILFWARVIKIVN